MIQGRIEILAESFLIQSRQKILADHEEVRSDWPVQGTTGYEFINQVNGLFVDASKQEDLDRVHRRFMPETCDFDEVVRESKRYVIKHVLSGELQILAAVLECTSRELLPESLRDLDRAAI